MLVGTDVCVRMVFVWEETGVPGGNPHGYNENKLVKLNLSCLTW